MASRIVLLPSLCRLVLIPALFALPTTAARAQTTNTPQTPARPQAPPVAQAPLKFPSGVELITVDAVVLDKDDRPVPGLTREDFVVKEDGRPREIVSFEAFSADTAAAEEPEAPAVVASNAPGPRPTGRAFAIVVDDVSLSPDQAAAARASATTFVERFARDTDLVTVATTSGSVWWSARIPEGREDLLAVVKRIQGVHVEVQVPERMTDYEAYWISHHEDSPSSSNLAPGSSVSVNDPTGRTATDLVPPGSIKERVKQRWERAGLCMPIYCDSLARARASEIDRGRANRTDIALVSVRRALESLAGVRGRKSLLFISTGFVQDTGSDTRGVAAASREANTAIYFVNARGLVALPGWGSAESSGRPPEATEFAQVGFEETTLESAGAAGLASDTGGFTVRNSNDLSTGAWRVAAESRVFYLLGFYPPEGKAERQWRGLKVEVNKPGLTVRARRGYTIGTQMAQEKPRKAGKPDKGPADDPAVQRALDSARDETAIPLRAITYVQEPRPGDVTHVLLAAEVDASTVVGVGASSTARLEVSAQVTMRDSGRVFRQDAAVTIASAAGQAPAWRTFTREFDLPPGVAQLRLVVRDPAGGTTGSVLQRFEVPFPGELRLSTPILTDRIEKAPAAGQPPLPALAAHREFSVAGGLYCQYEVFGAARPGGNAPQVEAAFEVRRSNGETVLQAPPTPIAVGSDGRLVRTVGTSLEGFQDGSYELVIQVSDRVAGSRLTRQEPFVVARNNP
jgi:VWFA-related protein